MTVSLVLAPTDPASARPPVLDRPPSVGRDVVDSPVDPHRPVNTVAELVRHVEAIVPVAVRRQLWTLFFDGDDVALPLMVPLEGVPETPDLVALAHYGDALAAVTREFGAATVAFVVERPGASRQRPADLRWLEGLVALADGRPFGVRTVLLCSDEGVSTLGPGSKPAPASASACGASVGGPDQASSRPVRLADIVRLP